MFGSDFTPKTNHFFNSSITDPTSPPICTQLSRDCIYRLWVITPHCTKTSHWTTVVIIVESLRDSLAVLLPFGCACDKVQVREVDNIVNSDPSPHPQLSS